MNTPYIPFKMPLEIINFRDIIKEAKETDFINELLGSFSNQNKVVKEISDLFLEMFKNNVTEKEVITNIDGDTIKINLKLVNGGLLNSSADIMPYGEKMNDGTIVLDKFVITLYLSQNITDIEKEIPSIISHELGHGNIFYKRIINNQDINVANWYSQIQQILRNDTVSENVRLYAYAIYAIYYQEKQAIISSTFEQVMEFFPNNRMEFIRNKIEKMSEKDGYNYLLKLYKEAIVKTEAYRTFYTIIDRLSKMSDKNKAEINNIFKINGINIGVDKELKKILLLAKNALKDVSRNGTLFFYNNLLTLIK